MKKGDLVRLGTSSDNWVFAIVLEVDRPSRSAKIFVNGGCLWVPRSRLAP